MKPVNQPEFIEPIQSPPARGWDAEIVAAAQVADCRFLVSEDLQDRQVLGAVRVVKPFSDSPDSIPSEV